VIDTFERLRSALADRYTLERELGAGGMATVYLADDRKHDRRVAVKVLRPELAAVIGAERFLNEIKVTAKLQHPHILQLYDSGEADKLLYYVMPYIKGESLRERLNREKELSVDEAVAITKAVASALDFAHREGVVHRDIKPENVLLHDGQAIVADFGIALALTAAGGSRLTETGLSLGTPHYMSPEQAAGDRELDGRTDLYSLGCMTYEMLTGRPPFDAPTAQAVVAKILAADAEIVTEHRRAVPPNVVHAVHCTIEKLPADRFSTVRAFADALDDPSFRHPAFASGGPGTDGRWNRVTTAFAVLSVVLATVVVASMLRRPAAGADPVLSRDRIILSEYGLRRNGIALRTALAADGSAIAFVDTIGGSRQLWLKERGELEPVPLPGTAAERIQGPAFSPDGGWIAFMADGKLKKVPRRGGAAITLADSVATSWTQVVWMNDESIVFNGPRWDIRRVGADGGTPETLYERTTGSPFVVGIKSLPGGRGVLWIGCNDQCTVSELHALDAESRDDHVLVEQAVGAWYTGAGVLVYVMRDGGVFAAPFDLEALAMTSPPVPILDGVRTGRQYADMQLASDGTVLYVAGPSADEANLFDLAWVDREGNVEPVDTAWVEAFSTVALSPDGGRMAVEALQAEDRHIWVKQLPNGPQTKLTVGGTNHRPSWSSDGRWVFFVSTRDSVREALFRTRADGSGSVELLASRPRLLGEAFQSSDGQWLILRTNRNGPGAGDIVAQRVAGDTVPVPLVATEFAERSPALSPDGRWLLYVSNISGRDEVYVRPFPDTDASRVQISTDGGNEPMWAHSGREIFCRNPEGWMVAAALTTQPTLQTTSQTPLFDWDNRFRQGLDYPRYAVAPNDQRFIMIRRSLDRPSDEGDVILVRNWLEYVAQ
jgi:serine/threonine-protein kinase